MRPGKLAGESAACAKGRHTRCTKENCTCRQCGHPEPVSKPKAPQREYSRELKTDDPSYRYPSPVNVIHDDLTGLPIKSKLQIRRQRRGLCVIPGCDEPRVNKQHCEKHRMQHLAYQVHSQAKRDFAGTNDFVLD
jgi:hypothetical protein